MRSCVRLSLIGICLTTAFAAGAGPEPGRPRRFALDDLDKLVRVSDPQLSPDGRSIVVVVSRPDFEKNRFESELVLVDVATGRQRVLTFERQGVGQPRWSPAGDRLAFLAQSGTGKDAKHQIFVLPMDGGDARRVTHAPAGVQHFAWKPDGSALAFATADEPPHKKEIDKHLDAFEVGNDGYLVAAAPSPTHIWLVAADGGQARRLTSGPWSLEVAPPPSTPPSPLSWSPDGRAIAFASQPRPSVGDRDRRTVHIVDVASGKVRPLTGHTAREGMPSFSPDGQQVAFWCPRDGDPNSVNEVWVAPATGGPGRPLTRDLDRCLYLSQWQPDGKALLVGGNDGHRISLWQQPLDGPARRLELGPVSPSWAYRVEAGVGKGGAVALVGSEPQRPVELYYVESPGSPARRLTDFNREVASRSLGRVETITWQGPDGFTENGVLTYPPDFTPGKTYPLVLMIHGGPSSASTETFSYRAQLMAARGYVVFEPNYRGSDNLGNAYKRAIFKDMGDGPGKDVMAGVDAIKKRGFVDEGCIAVSGWSYGGYMTAWLIGHYGGWKAAVAGAAVTDLAEQYNLSDGNVGRREAYGGSPWEAEHEARYRTQSPITYARQIRTPTLILATTGDARVPVTQSYRLYRVLKENGVPVKFVAYPVPGHSPADPVRQKDVTRRWIAWLDEHLR
jgi:dipeptidyl aminopeptidase/acylaminoacyl peptidase